MTEPLKPGRYFVPDWVRDNFFIARNRNELERDQWDGGDWSNLSSGFKPLLAELAATPTPENMPSFDDAVSAALRADLIVAVFRVKAGQELPCKQGLKAPEDGVVYYCREATDEDRRRRDEFEKARSDWAWAHRDTDLQGLCPDCRCAYEVNVATADLSIEIRTCPSCGYSPDTEDRDAP